MLSNSAEARSLRVLPSPLSHRPVRGLRAPAVGPGRAAVCAAFPQPGRDAAGRYLRAEARWDLFISPRGWFSLCPQSRGGVSGAGAEVCWVEAGAHCLERGEGQRVLSCWCCLCGTVVRLKSESFGFQGVASKSVSPKGNFGIKRNEPSDILSTVGLDFLPLMSVLFHFSLLLTQGSPVLCSPLLYGWEAGCLRDPCKGLLPCLFSHAPY